VLRAEGAFYLRDLLRANLTNALLASSLFMFCVAKTMMLRAYSTALLVLYALTSMDKPSKAPKHLLLYCTVVLFHDDNDYLFICCLDRYCPLIYCTSRTVRGLRVPLTYFMVPACRNAAYIFLESMYSTCTVCHTYM
jgi:hypothetical protein